MTAEEQRRGPEALGVQILLHGPRKDLSPKASGVPTPEPTPQLGGGWILCVSPAASQDPEGERL